MKAINRFAPTWDEETSRQLAELALAEGETRSSYLRRLIRAEYRKLMKTHPTTRRWLESERKP